MTMFDSLGYAQRLIKSGMPQGQAETEVELIRDEVVANAASNEDITHLAERFDQRAKTVETNIARTEERLVLELKLQEPKLTTELRGYEQKSSSEIKLLEHRLTNKLYATAAFAVTLIVALQKLFES